MATPNRTASTGVAIRHGYEAILTLRPLPPGEREALSTWFERNVAGPLGLEVESAEYGRAWAVALETWRACLEHGWKVAGREARAGMGG